MPATAGPRPLASHDVYWVHAWALGGDRYIAKRNRRPRGLGLEARLRRELLFCLLGGHGIAYELNRSAADQMWKLGVLTGETVSAANVYEQLTRPQFEPLRHNGHPRRYRFPARKAELLSRASAWLSERQSLSELILESEVESDRRRALLDCPGLGFKSASWLLRNVGLAQRLAILDIHVLRTMRACDRIPVLHLPAHYARAEQAFLHWCDDLQVQPAGFDLLVWDWSRRRSHG